MRNAETTVERGNFTLDNKQRLNFVLDVGRNIAGALLSQESDKRKPGIAQALLKEVGKGGKFETPGIDQRLKNSPSMAPFQEYFKGK